MTPANHPTYTERALTLLADREPLEVLGELEGALTSAIEGETGQALATPEAAGRWSAAQVLGHLLDTELVYGFRLRQTLIHDDPEFERFDQDRWVERFGDCAGDTANRVQRLVSMRGWHLQIIRSLTESELRRTSVHSSRGTETVRRMVDLWAAHDLLHRRQLKRILAAVRR